jgi:hypothetical protein
MFGIPPIMAYDHDYDHFGQGLKPQHRGENGHGHGHWS